MQLGIFFHFLTTHTEGDIDGKVKVGDVPHCAIKLQAETELCPNIFKKSLPYEHPKDCDEDGYRPHFLCTEEIQVAGRGPGSRHLTSISDEFCPHVFARSSFCFSARERTES